MKRAFIELRNKELPEKKVLIPIDEIQYVRDTEENGTIIYYSDGITQRKVIVLDNVEILFSRLIDFRNDFILLKGVSGKAILLNINEIHDIIESEVPYVSIRLKFNTVIGVTETLDMIVKEKDLLII